MTNLSKLYDMAYAISGGNSEDIKKIDAIMDEKSSLEEKEKALNRYISEKMGQSPINATILSGCELY